MSFTLSTLDDSRIIVVTENSDFDSFQETDAVVRDVIAMLSEAEKPIVCLFDSRAHMATTLAVGTLVRSQEGRELIKHPKLMKLVAVTNNRAALLELKCINSATFGFVEIGIFSNMEDAIEYTQRMIHTKQKMRYDARTASAVPVRV